MIRVATGGVVDQHIKCLACGELMIYRVDDSERMTSSFCGNSLCSRFLIERRTADTADGRFLVPSDSPLLRGKRR